jgi:hypothetical protein
MQLIAIVFIVCCINSAVSTQIDARISLHDDLLTVYKELEKPDNFLARNFFNIHIEPSTRSCVLGKLGLTDDDSPPAYEIEDVFIYFYRKSQFNRKKQLVFFYASILCAHKSLTESFQVDLSRSHYISLEDMNCLMWQLKLTDRRTAFVDDVMELTNTVDVCNFKFENFKKHIIDVKSRRDLITRCIDDEEEYEDDNIKVYIQSMIMAYEKPTGDVLEKYEKYHNKVLRKLIEKELKCALVDLYDNCDEKELVCG